MPEVLDWQRADQRDVVRRAVQALREGRLVAFPAETTYHLAASALLPAAVDGLAPHVEADERPLMLAVRGAADALDWAPGISPLGRRLTRRCWPGPVAFDLGDGVAHGLAGRLPEAVRRQVCHEGALRLCAPGHEAILHALGDFGGPVAAGACRGVTAEQILEAAGENVALVIDDGPSQFAQPATVVRVNGESWSVVRGGVVDEATLAQLSPCTIVFVCTGNTCRSPLAEALCKKLLAERLGCAVADLPKRGYQVLSAGLSAMNGDAAASAAVEVARELGADLTEHRSRRLTHDLLTAADHLLTMTQGHLRALAPYCGGGVARPRLLSPQGLDVPDPIGSDEEVYRDCAREIARYLEEFLPEVSGR
jgi:protein-tyrosine phosphatase